MYVQKIKNHNIKELEVKELEFTYYSFSLLK